MGKQILKPTLFEFLLLLMFYEFLGRWHVECQSWLCASCWYNVMWWMYNQCCLNVHNPSETMGMLNAYAKYPIKENKGYLGKKETLSRLMLEQRRLVEKRDIRCLFVLLSSETSGRARGGKQDIVLTVTRSIIPSEGSCFGRTGRSSMNSTSSESSWDIASSSIIIGLSKLPRNIGCSDLIRSTGLLCSSSTSI